MLKRSLIHRIWYWTAKRTLQLLWVVLYGVRFSGTHNIPREGGVLLLSNHQSHFDPPLVCCCCPRRVNPLAKKSLFDFRPFGLLLASLGAFPVDREGSPLGGIKGAMRRLKQGKVVLMFPEGQRCEDGRIGDFLEGFTMIAVRSNAAIVPAAVEGPFRAWPRTRKFPILGPRMHVMFGEPIMPDELSEYKENELLAEVRRRIEQCHGKLLLRPDYVGRSR